VLLSKSLQLLGQSVRISIRKCVQAINPQLEEHLPPLGANTTDLTEMPNPTGLGVTHTSPAAQRALTPVRDQRGWLGPLQIRRQFAQCLIQLTLQGLTKSNSVLLEVTACSRQSQPFLHGSVLKQCQQTC